MCSLSLLLTLQLGGRALLLLLLCEGLLQPADLLLVLGGRVSPVLQLRSYAAKVGLQGSNLALTLQRGSLHGIPQDENLAAETQSVDRSVLSNDPHIVAAESFVLHICYLLMLAADESPSCG